ncbi:putative reverse transcriptase domain-containing protein [Tanacetum coccineum]
MSKNLKKHGFVSTIQQRTNHKDLQNCLFACFLSQEEPKKVIHALKDPSWIEAMQEELLQFKLQEVWTSMDLPNGKRAICTKWVFKNKKDERGIVIRNKARLVCQPPGFEDPDFPNREYKVEKALYGLHQATRADLQLEDAEGVDFLPNSTIFEQLTLMGGPTEHVADEAVYKELDDNLVKGATTASSLEAEQDSGNIAKT